MLLGVTEITPATGESRYYHTDTFDVQQENVAVTIQDDIARLDVTMDVIVSSPLTNDLIQQQPSLNHSKIKRSKADNKNMPTSISCVNTLWTCTGDSVYFSWRNVS
jgi:hypothetical protein